MKELKKQIKARDFKKCYLFFGDESYLKTYYEGELKKNIINEGLEMMNLDIFEDKPINIDDIINSASTLPFMSEKRLIIIKNSELFKSGKKADSEKMVSYIEKIPESTCLLFIEAEIDKRSRLYKAVQNYGYAVEFKSPRESELIKWLQNIFNQNGKQLEQSTLQYLLKTVGTDMELLKTESQKLISYKLDDYITIEDIDNICTKSTEAKIFDMLDAMGNKKPDIALEILSSMFMMKEAPIKILTLIIRQFRLIFQTKFLSLNSYDLSSIATRLNQRPFIIKGILAQSQNYSLETLKQALEDCLETDISIKSGSISGQTGIELLIIKYSVN